MTTYIQYRNIQDDENGTPYCKLHSQRMSLRRVVVIDDVKIRVYGCDDDETHAEFRGMKDED